MILLENDFLKTYNEIDSLWEDVDTASSTSTYTYSFEEIVDKAIAAGELTKEDEFNYWCEVRKRIVAKHVRPGEPECKSWCTKFMSFYKAYKAECAIKDWLSQNGKAYGIDNVSFSDNEDHNKLLAESGEPKPDLHVKIAGVERTIECKTIDVTASIHEADLVARHTAVDPAKAEQDIRFCLVGQPGKRGSSTQGCVVSKSGEAVFDKNQERRLRVGKLLSVINRSERSLRDGFNKAFLTNFGRKVRIEFETDLPSALETIDQQLDKNTQAVEKKLDLLFNKHIDTLDNTTKNLLDKHYPTDERQPEVELPSGSLEQAAQNLSKVAKDLID